MTSTGLPPPPVPIPGEPPEPAPAAPPAPAPPAVVVGDDVVEVVAPALPPVAGASSPELQAANDTAATMIRTVKRIDFQFMASKVAPGVSLLVPGVKPASARFSL